MSERMSLVPGVKVRLTSKAGVGYEGKLTKFDDEEGTITIENGQVFSFGTVNEETQPSTAAAARFVDGYGVFRRSELTEIQVLNNGDQCPSGSPADKADEDCSASRARNFSNEVLTWIQQGDNEKISLLLEDSHLHEVFDPTKKTLLHYAVEYNNATIVKKLLSVGSNVNAQDSIGMTPLMLAMEERRKDQEANWEEDWEMMKVILAAAPNIFIVNKKGKSAVHMYCENYERFYHLRWKLFEKLTSEYPCKEDIVDRLIDAGCSLYQVYESFKDIEMIEMMLQRGLPVNELDAIVFESVLHLAVASQDLECIELLLKHGADAESENGEGRTPLSCLHDEIEADKDAAIVKLLLDYGASATSRTWLGKLRAEQKLEIGEKEVIRVLLQHNIDFTATHRHTKECALHYLATNTNAGVAEELKMFGKKINVNARDEQGFTPLHWAAQCANFDMLALLLSMGAEVDAIGRMTWNYTPLYFAMSRFHSERESYSRCIELLLQHDANPQFVITTADGERVTLFEATFNAEDVERSMPLVAQLAILERRGTKIVQSVQAKINAHPALIEHLSKCRLLLKQEISGSLTLFKLLAADEKKMARYLENEELALKMKGLMDRLESSCSYYYNWLKARYSEGVRYKTLKGEAAQVICSIFKEIVCVNIDVSNLVVDSIIAFLEEESLMEMSKVSLI